MSGCFSLAVSFESEGEKMLFVLSSLTKKTTLSFFCLVVGFSEFCEGQLLLLFFLFASSLSCKQSELLPTQPCGVHEQETQGSRSCGAFSGAGRNTRSNGRASFEDSRQDLNLLDV